MTVAGIDFRILPMMKIHMVNFIQHKSEERGLRFFRSLTQDKLLNWVVHLRNGMNITRPGYINLLTTYFDRMIFALFGLMIF